MRKIFTLLFATAFALAGTVQAQCTPNPGITDPGIYPTPVDGVPNGTVGTPYNHVLTVNVPLDTTVDLSQFFPGAPTVTVTVNYLTIDNFTGLPTGLTHTCNPSNCNIVGGNSGCIEVAGTPTVAGQYVANLATTMNVTVPQSVPFIGGTQQNVPGPLAYNYEVMNTTAVNPSAGDGFWVGAARPNPASGLSKVDFHTTAYAAISLEVFSLTGQRVFGQSGSYASGDHTIDLDVSNLNAGMYFYTLSNGQEKVTRRLVVTH